MCWIIFRMIAKTFPGNWQSLPVSYFVMWLLCITTISFLSLETQWIFFMRLLFLSTSTCIYLACLLSLQTIILPQQAGASEAVPWGERCRALLQKVQRRRQALAPHPQTPPPSEDSREDEQQQKQEEEAKENQDGETLPQSSKDDLQRLEEEVWGFLKDCLMHVFIHIVFDTER